DDDPDRAPDVAAPRHERRARGPRDRGARAAVLVALLPLVGEGRGVAGPVPVDAVSVWPCRAVPVTTGSVRLTGGVGSGVTTAVAAEVPVSDPPLFVPVTTTRISCPTS